MSFWHGGTTLAQVMLSEGVEKGRRERRKRMRVSALVGSIMISDCV